MGKIYGSALELIGNTPLVEVKNVEKSELAYDAADHREHPAAGDFEHHIAVSAQVNRFAPNYLKHFRL